MGIGAPQQASNSGFVPYDPSLNPAQLAADINADPNDQGAVGPGADTASQIAALSSQNASSGKDYTGAVNAGDIDYNGVPLSQLGTDPHGVGYTLLGSGLANPGLTVDGQPISIQQQNAASNSLSDSQETSTGQIIGDVALAGLAAFGGWEALEALGGDAGGTALAAGATDAGGLSSTDLAFLNSDAGYGGVAAVPDAAAASGGLSSTDLAFLNSDAGYGSIGDAATAGATASPAAGTLDANGNVVPNYPTDTNLGETAFVSGGADPSAVASPVVGDTGSGVPSVVPDSGIPSADASGGLPGTSTTGGTYDANGNLVPNYPTDTSLGQSTFTSDGVGPGVSGNSSVQNALSQLGALGNGALKYAPLAGLGLNLAAYKKSTSAAQQLNNVAAPESAVANQLLGQYKTGTINASDAYQISQWQQQQTASLKQYYASAGLSNSSMEAEALSNVGAQAEAMRAQAVQNLLTGGLNAAGVAQGPQLAAVQAGVAADTALSNSTASFLAALAKMNTSSSSTPPLPTTT